MDMNKSADIKNGSVNDRPLFMQNGNRGFAMNDSQEISNFRQALPQFLAVSVKNILLFVYGMTLGFPTIVIPAIQGGDGREHSDIVLNKDEISWFSSINLICVPLGCLFSGLLTQPIGKRRAMQMVNIPILASWLLFHFATKTEHLYAALCLSGLGGGLMEAPVLTYVAEITEPKYRGILSALGSTCVITGIFIEFIMGSLMDWRTVAAISSAFPVISIISLCFIPESPTWLIRKQRFREAIKALQWLRGWVSEQHIEEEFNSLYDELITQPALEERAEEVRLQDGCKKSFCSRFRMFKKRSFLMPFSLVAFTFFVGHFSGKTSLQTYAVQIFHTLKAPINKYHATILLGMAEMVATIMCVLLIHFTGKRPLVFISTVGVALCWFGTATYAHYLKVVPGFAVDNVVVNASSIVPKDNIISRENITKIFESEEKALLLKAQVEMDIELTTLSYLEGITASDSTINKNRSRRQTPNSTMEPYNISFVDLTDLDYNGSISNYTEITPHYDLNDSNESEDKLTTTVMPQDKLLSVFTTPTSITTTKTTIHSKPNLLSRDQSSLPKDILLEVPKQEKNYLVWIPLILLLGAAFFAHFGIRMIPWMLIGEVFPAPVRSTASGIVSGIGYIFGFLANKLFLQMLSALTLPGTFWFYSVVSIVGAITLYFTLPETESRTLGEIEAHFSKKSDKNLLCKKQQKLERLQKRQKQQPAQTCPIHLNNLEGMQISIAPYTESKIIQLQQSDFSTNNNNNINTNGNQGGITNMAYEENNTTHL